MPIVLVHLWLPREHVEAPVSGSMILVGVFKVGGAAILAILNQNHQSVILCIKDSITLLTTNLRLPRRS